MTIRSILIPVSLLAMFAATGCKRQVAFDKPMTIGETLSVTEVRKSLGEPMLEQPPTALGGGPTTDIPLAPEPGPMPSTPAPLLGGDAGK